MNKPHLYLRETTSKTTTTTTTKTTTTTRMEDFCVGRHRYSFKAKASQTSGGRGEWPTDGGEEGADFWKKRLEGGNEG